MLFACLLIEITVSNMRSTDVFSFFIPGRKVSNSTAANHWDKEEDFITVFVHIKLENNCY